jgi:EAL domain-containing protein (putative c-di-GMP-specific phosphodiesterase class I)
MPILRARAQGRRELDLELRRAFENQEFALYFQPQIRLSDGALVGAEALIRWRHPTHGVIEPGAFIEALSDGAIAAAVGKWILQSACKTLATWHAQGLALPRIAVNLFPTQVSSDALLSDVEDVLRSSGLAAAALELEITEKVALDYSNAALSLKQVSERGVYIAFDDFGTGYASVSSLTKYPVNRIKIDQSFVRDIEHNREHAAIVRSLIMMGHNLGLLVVAEGVETDLQARLLRAEGCDEAQGYLYARPLPRHEFEQYMRATHFPAASPLRWAHGSRA